jgi:hypothetical protein
METSPAAAVVYRPAFSASFAQGACLIVLVVLLIAVLAFVIQASLYLRELSCDIAVSNAQDQMILCYQ